MIRMESQPCIRSLRRLVNDFASQVLMLAQTGVCSPRGRADDEVRGSSAPALGWVSRLARLRPKTADSRGRRTRWRLTPVERPPSIGADARPGVFAAAARAMRNRH